MKYFDSTNFALSNAYRMICSITPENIDHSGNILSKFTLPPKKKKEFRKVLDIFYHHHQDKIPADVLEKISAAHSEQEIIDFLYEANILRQKTLERVYAQNRSICDEFPSDISVLLLDIDDTLFYCDNPLIVNEKGELKVVFSESYGFQDALIFQNAIVTNPIEACYVLHFEYSKHEDDYVLEVACEEGIVTIQFQSIEHQTEFYDYSSIGNGITFTNDNYQWITLANILSELRSIEQRFGVERLNDKEKALLPLVHFGPLINYSTQYGFNPYIAASGIEPFKHYVIENHADFLLPLIEKVKRSSAQVADDDMHARSRYRVKNKWERKLSIALRDHSCEPLWRQLYQDIKEAASYYPQKISVNITEAEEIRSQITQALYSQGFEGTYPNFHKVSPLKGIKLLENQSGVYFAFKKKMVSYIFCEEDIRFGERLSVAFVCGLIFLKKGEIPNLNLYDVYSTFFIEKYRRFSTVVQANNRNNVTGEQIDEAEVALIAAKKACLQKITKEEKEKTVVADNTSITALLIGFTVFGTIFFGLAMMLGFMLITFVLVLIFTQSLLETMNMFRTIPWHWVFWGSGLPFGIILGLFTALAKRKR